MASLLATSNEIKSKQEDKNVTLNNSLEQVLAIEDDYDKLVLIFVYEVYDDMKTILDIILDNELNSIFKSDFHVLSLNAKSNANANDIAALNLQAFSFSFIDLLFIARLEDNEVIVESTIDISNNTTAEIIDVLNNESQNYQLHLFQQRNLEFDEYTKKLHDSWNIQYYTFDQAIDLTLKQHFSHLRKLLMLYIYRSDSKLCQSFNDCLAPLSSCYKNVLLTLVWEPKSTWNALLTNLCDGYFGEECIKECIASKEGGIFFIAPVEHDGKVQAKILSAITSLEKVQAAKIDLIVESLVQNFIQCNKITVPSEEEAIESFNIQKRTVKDKIIKDSLCNIIEKCQSERKMLLFYMGGNRINVWHDISTKIQSSLQHNTYELLVWNTTNANRNEYLSIALKRAFNMDKLEVMLKQQVDVLFVFVPIANSLFLHTVIDEKSFYVESKLKEAHRFFTAENAIAINEYNNNGPVAYQQIMCESMGDRDFDCFQMENKDQATAFVSKVAFAYFGPPQNENGRYSKKQEEVIFKACKCIVEIASEYGENANTLYVSFMRVCLTPFPHEKLKKKQKDAQYDPTFDFDMIPLFGIRKCQDGTAKEGSCRLFVDHTGRTYDSWNNFLEDNRYPKALMIAPRNGRYRLNLKDKVELDIIPTPACGIGPAILKGFDIGTSVVGVAAGVAAVASTVVAVPFLPIIAMSTGVGVGIYGISRSISSIVDRVKHRESMSLSESEARAAYLNIIAGSLGFTTAGATMALSAFVKNGATIGLGVRAAMNGLTAVNVAASGAALGNSIYDYATNTPDDAVSNTLIIIQLTSSVLFFGHSLYNVETANGIINRSQSAKLGEFMESLSSNRLRKSFNKLLRETVRNTGNTQTGCAEVISYLNKADNVQDVVRTLTRNGKMFSKNGVKFSVQNNKVLFNKVEINVTEFANMSKTQKIDVLSSLESLEPRQRSFNNMTPSTSQISGKLVVGIGMEILSISKPNFEICMSDEIAEEKVRKIVKSLSTYIQSMLFGIVNHLWLNIHNTNFCTMLNNIMPGFRTIVFKLTRICLDYFGNIANAQKGGEVSHNAISKCIIEFKCEYDRKIVEIEKYVSDWIVKHFVKETLLEEPPKIEVMRQKVRCLECRGTYYAK